MKRISRVNLQKKDFRGADLDGAKLQGADLRNTTLIASKGLSQEMVQYSISNSATRLPHIIMPDTFEVMKLKQCYSFLDVAHLRSTYCHFCYNGMDITTFEQRLEKFACPLTESD